VCEELQLLMLSVLPLSEKFSMSDQFTHIASSECKPSLLLTIAQGYFASDFSKK
jgi:hypothetical protein